MKKTLNYLTLFILLALLLVPTSSAHAQGVNTDGGRVIFGSNFTLKSGDEFNGDLVVFGGNVTVEQGADLNGNLVVFGGTVSADGNVNGDVVVIGGQVKLEEKAMVTGDVVTIGGQLQQAEGAIVKGEVVNNISPEIQLPNGTHATRYGYSQCAHSGCDQYAFQSVLGGRAGTGICTDRLLPGRSGGPVLPGAAGPRIPGSCQTAIDDHQHRLADHCGHDHCGFYDHPFAGCPARADPSGVRLAVWRDLDGTGDR